MAKIGYWLPFRTEMTSVTYEAPGMLLKEVRDSFISHLRTGSDVEMVEFGDFRNGLVVNGEAVIGGKPVEGLDAFVWFGEIGRDYRMEHNVGLLRSMERHTKVANPPDGFETAMDKFLTSSTLSRNGIRVPKFMLLTPQHSEEAEEILSPWRPVLLKPRLGSYGMGIIRISSASEVADHLDYMPPSTHYLEQLIPNDPSQWIGVNVIGGKHAYSYRKGPESFHDGWKVLDRKRVGGKMLLAEPNDEQRKIAEKVAALLGLAWCGVDIITGKDGRHYVVDVNAYPGLYPEMFTQAGIDGPKLMAGAVLSQIGD